MFKVGDIVELRVPCLSNRPGDRGIVYEEYSGGGCSVIFFNGQYDGFSEFDQKEYLKRVGNLKKFKYNFTNVLQLEKDFRGGYFKSVFEEIQKLKIAQCKVLNNSKEDFPEFDSELEKILKDNNISKPE